MAFDVSVQSKRGKRSRVTPSMNVTPLVDVVLVLLIIFMVITPMMVKQMQMFVPKRDEKAAESKEDPGDDAPSSIVLSVRREGIFLNKERIQPSELASRLENVFANRTEKLLFFDADENLPYGRAVEVLDLARGAGAKHIAVLTQPVKL
jgi:biopolymer transport protein ExbD/biopolymer transport protein TolR